MNALLSPISRPIEQVLIFIGEVTLLVADAFKRLFAGKVEVKETINQMAFVGVNSVPIVALTGFFSGAVFSLYLSSFLNRYGAGSFVGATVALSMIREIGPVLAGIMVSARCGSAMAAQIGTMQVTEQVDALRMLSVHPTNYLVIPRMVASIFMLPILAMICMTIGIGGGLLVAMSENIAPGTYLTSITQFVKPDDIVKGLIKAPVFDVDPFCQKGLRTSSQRIGIGKTESCRALPDQTSACHFQLETGYAG